MENTDHVPRDAAELLQIYTDSKHNEVIGKIDLLKTGQDRQQQSIDILTRAVVGENASGNTGLLARISEMEKQVGKLQTYVIAGYGGAGTLGLIWGILKGLNIIK